MKTTTFLKAGLTAAALTLISCSPTQQKYGLLGAAGGAAAGALLGGDDSDIGKGAAAGAALGTGYGVYKDRQQQSNPPSGGAYGSPAPQNPQPEMVPPPRAVPPTNAPDYPKAWSTDTPGIVISPYKPYNKVNVRGFEPGQLARDPKTNEIFVVPN